MGEPALYSAKQSYPVTPVSIGPI